MEKELKISELASIWGVSVPTTWNRVRKEGLKTVKKIDETGKEITYIAITDELLNKRIKTVVNIDNKHYYEDILTDNNFYNNNNNINNVPNSDNNGVLINELFDKLTTINNEYNDRLERINNELINYKSKNLLLEDKAGREGFYLNEINTLKTDNKRLTKWLLTSVIIFIITFMSLVAFACYYVVWKSAQIENTPQVENVEQKDLQQVTTSPVAQVQAPAPWQARKK